MMNPTSSEIAEAEMMNPSTSTNMAQEHRINIPAASWPPPIQPSANLPAADLLGSRDKYFEICVPLYEASIIGDWEVAEVIFHRHPEYVRFAITENYDTALHVSAPTEETKVTARFVDNLVKQMEGKDLELHNKNGNTALCLASAAGNINMVRIMVDKNKNLVNIPGSQGMMPLLLSVLHGKYETVKYLYEVSDKMSGKRWTHENQGWMLEKCVECDYFDIARSIVFDHPKLALNGSVLGALARKPAVEQTNLLTRIINSISRILHMKVGSTHHEKENDALELLKIIWVNTILIMSKSEVDNMLRGPSDPTMPKSEVDDILRRPLDPILGTPSTDLTNGRPRYFSRGLFVAAEMGNTIFVVELLRAYPDLIFDKNDDNYSIFHVAVMNRHHDIYNLLYEIGAMKDLIISLEDRSGNNMLHLVGKTSVKMRPQTSRASLLMQRELLWFKEIEKIIPPSYRERKNKDDQTPYGLFFEENKDLVSQGLNWMKDCMVVVTLIVTVAFAVAFTVPGGYNQNNGIPIFIHEKSFLVFVIADAISLFSSSTSLLVFLFTFTSRQGQRDFVYSLPRKLMIGLVILFIAVAAMMVSFSASFFVLYHKGVKWVAILIAVFAAMPVIVFAVLQFRLLVDMFRSTYDSRYLFNSGKRMLYNKNRQRFIKSTS